MSLRRNLRAAFRRPRVLVVRLEPSRPYRHFLVWLGEHDPELRRLFDLRCTGERIWRLGRYRLIVNWTPDPLNDVDPRAYAWMRELEARADALGIPVLNRATDLSRSRKSIQTRILREAGLFTPPVGAPGDFDFPVVVRSDVDHSGRLYRLDSKDEQERFDWSLVHEPVVSPFVETRSPDGFYRKYRYFLCGDRGAPRHLQISRDWLVRMDQRDLRPANIEEEERYTAAPDPNHDLLDRARRALGFDMVAFDYSYRPDGSVVVWEANPFPDLWIDDPKIAYQWPAVQRLFATWRDGLRERLVNGP